MEDIDMVYSHRNDLVRDIEYHQKMAFELKENLNEMDYLIETKNLTSIKRKIGV